jgi:hypothetical protein
MITLDPIGRCHYAGGHSNQVIGAFQDRFQMSNATNYDVLPGGGFLMLRGAEEVRRLTVMVNWLTEINRHARTGER